MRIRLETTDRLPFWLIGDPTLNERTEGSRSLNESVQITRNQQTVSGAEWEAKTFIDRGNQSIMVEVSGRREFATEWERWQFLESLAPTDPDDELHRWYGDIWLRFPNADETFNECLLPDAIISLTGKQLQGEVGLMLNYRIQAAGFDVAAEQSGMEMVSLVADGISSDTCQMVIYATTTGGAWDTATTVDAGTAPSTLAAGNTLTITVGDDDGVITTKAFKAVAPGGSTPGFIAIETPVVSNLSVIADAFAGIANITAVAGTFGGRAGVYIGWGAEPILLADNVRITIELGSGYIAYSAADDFAAVITPGVTLYDVREVHLISDRLT
jgi:hypothetical protein